MAKYLYNGVLLPEIPAELLKTDPSVVIFKRANGQYRLLASPNGFYMKNATAVYEKNSVVNKAYLLSDDESEWIDENNNTYSGWTIGTFLWTNHDLPNGSATASVIYHAAARALPENIGTMLVTSIEAETGSVSGGAIIGDRMDVSGNVVVDMIQRYSGSLTVVFPAATEDFYLLRMFYTHSGDRDFKYSLNGKTYTKSVTGTTYYGVDYADFQIYLAAGSNIVVFSGNSTAYAPMFDKFEIYAFVSAAEPVRICGNVVGYAVPQSDWAQKDPKQASYIKNKPNGAMLVPEYTEADYGKVLSYSENGLVWISLDLQDKSVSPTAKAQEIVADTGFYGLRKVTVEAAEVGSGEGSGTTPNLQFNSSASGVIPDIPKGYANAQLSNIKNMFEISATGTIS